MASLIPDVTAAFDGLHTPVEVARQARLRYVNDGERGIRRRKAGKGFVYRDAEGSPVKDAATLERIRSLAIPPGWTDVWICRLSDGHIQATGRDARGRKQYRYHDRWREVSNLTKFDKLAKFGCLLPRIRRRVEQDLAQRHLSREKVVAIVIRLLDETLIRVGNECYVRENDSYGLATLRDEHAQIKGSLVRFHFHGKSGIYHQVDLHDRRLARIVQECQDVPGQELFQYFDDDGSHYPIGSSDVNTYLQEVTGQLFTAKIFRTWKATALVTATLQEHTGVEQITRRKRIVNEALRHVSSSLGNTPTVCKKYYVHPGIADLYLRGEMADICRTFRPRGNKWLSAPEQLLLHVLHVAEMTSASNRKVI